MSTEQLTLTFDGATYTADDKRRLNRQYRNVWSAMSDGQPHTLYELSERTGYPEQSISARIRDFRKPRNGSHTVTRTRVSGGVYAYTLIPNRAWRYAA
jgi:hypothetical protein